MKTFSILLLLLSVPILGVSQSNVSPFHSDEYYFRLLQISGLSDDVASYQLRPYFHAPATAESHPWDSLYQREEPAITAGRYAEVNFFEPVLFQSYNTTLPRGNNDGAIWQGKGYNNAFSAGIEASFGPLYIRFRPVVGMAQNRAFDLGPYEPPEIRNSYYGIQGTSSVYAYRDFRGSIDYVQRFGDDTYSWFDLGESSVELRYSGFRVALSNQQIWTGPAINTALQFGYSAPGFRHFYAGTYKPVETIAGSFEFAYIFGGTRESDYYSENRAIGMQSVNSLIFSYSPWFTDRFSLGAVRTYFHPYPQSFSEYRRQAKKLFEAGLRNALTDDGEPRGHDPDNQLGTVFFRYIMPEYGFEIYGEYGRNDHNANWRDFRAQYNHHRAYSIGAIKTMGLPKDRLLAVNIELNQLEAMRTALTRGNRHLGGWYTHGAQIIGFANNGQILGSGYGPGVNMQKVRTDIYDKLGGLSFTFARIVYHNSRADQFFESIEEANSENVNRWEVRNVEYMLGAEVTAFIKYGIEFSLVLEQSYILNQHNLKDNDTANTRLEVVLRKQMPGWKR